MSESLARKLSRWRGKFAKTYKRYVPQWSGGSYPRRSQYPHAPDGLDFTTGNNARSAVFACDFLLRVLNAARSKNGYELSERRLADFAEWYSFLVAIEQESDYLKKLFHAGLNATTRRPKAMHKGRIQQAAQLRRENRQRADEALAKMKRKYPTEAEDNKTSFLADKAAESLGISRSTFYRWRRATK